jgi:lipopolysaccharide export LptBFGC system permease protein LptF
VVSALFLWFIEVGRMLGNSGSMPPLAAAWLPNGVFGALAFWGWRDLR